MINLKDQPAQYVTHVAKVTAVDAATLDIELTDPSQPLLTIIAAPEFVAMEKALVVEHGGTDAPDAKETDKATEWLNDNSAGTGPTG